MREHSAELAQKTKVTDPLNAVGLLRATADIAGSAARSAVGKVKNMFK